MKFRIRAWPYVTAAVVVQLSIDVVGGMLQLTSETLGSYRAASYLIEWVVVSALTYVIAPKGMRGMWVFVFAGAVVVVGMAPHYAFAAAPNLDPQLMQPSVLKYVIDFGSKFFLILGFWLAWFIAVRPALRPGGDPVPLVDDDDD